VDLSSKRNHDAEMAARSAGCTPIPLVDRVVKLVYNTFADVVIFNGVSPSIFSHEPLYFAGVSLLAHHTGEISDRFSTKTSEVIRLYMFKGATAIVFRHNSFFGCHSQ
jgi:hypothetical protein